MRGPAALGELMGIPHDLEEEGKCLKKGKSAFRRNGGIIVQVWKDKTCAIDRYDP